MRKIQNYGSLARVCPILHPSLFPYPLTTPPILDLSYSLKGHIFIRKFKNKELSFSNNNISIHCPYIIKKRNSHNLQHTLLFSHEEFKLKHLF